MSAAEIADIRHTVESVERKFAGLEGRLESVVGQVRSLDDRVLRVTDLMKDVLEFSAAQIAELRKSLDSTDEHLRSVRETLNVTAEQQGRMLRELAELRK